MNIMIVTHNKYLELGLKKIIEQAFYYYWC